MSADPTLIIQMQRMGDLLLSFPLFSRLLALEPERPVWVVAEPAFFSELMPLAPGVVFFEPAMAPQLRTARFHRVINLSHREAALTLAGSVEAGERTGAFRRGGILYIEGDWRLYRASIVGNSRHNRFHWSDLEALGIIPPDILAATRWPGASREGPAGEEAASGARSGGRVGLFVGASEEEKRPDPAFWGRLARLLAERGLRPVLLGGPAERGLAAEAARLGGLPERADFSGRFRLSELAAFMRSLALVITPDTGPMHLAAWVGAPVLDLSMGTVNAFETAPAPPGHLVLRAAGSCAECWRCARSEVFCRRRFRPETVADLAADLARGRRLSGGEGPPPGLVLSRTGRDARGLFTLETLAGNQALRQRAKLAAFWREWFLSALGGAPHDLPAARGDLAAAAPHLSDPLRENAVRLTGRLGRALKEGEALPGDFWRAVPPLLRPLSGYLHLVLQNGDFARPAWARALALAAKFAEATA